MPERDRDRSVENVLRHVLSDDVRAESQSTCPDAETIASWQEGSLRAEDAAGMERHVADCIRCRALMAAFIQTTPADPAVESLWRRWRLGWVVPLATAATAAALWIAVPDNGPAPSLSAGRDAGTVSVDATRPAAPLATPPTAASEPAAPTSAETLQKPGAPVRNEERKRASERESPRAELSDERAAADAALTPPIEADKKENAVNSAPRALAAARQASPPFEIVAPGGSARWRIVSGRQVEWSSFTSTEWGPAIIEPADVLTAGTAPSASVCWIVGRRGAVYVTTDGVRFTRIPFPEMADLVAVTASDDRSATVSASDGRSWATSDQGRTWTPQDRN